MFKIQNKNNLKPQFSVLVIDISVIRICLAFRYSNFPVYDMWLNGLTSVLFYLAIKKEEFKRRGTRPSLS